MIDPDSDLARMKEAGINYVYVISPYTHPEEKIMEIRYDAALQACGEMIMEGFHVLSVIVHCHPIAQRFNLPRDRKFWGDYDDSFIIKWAEAGYVLRFRGWSHSKGTRQDLEIFRTANKQVYYSNHYDIP